MEFFHQLVENPAFHGVLREEIENEAILGLAVTVNAAHALFEPVRIPRNIEVEQDMAALEVDALACRLGRHKDLRFQLPEVALGPKTCALLITASRLHAAVNLADRQAP